MTSILQIQPKNKYSVIIKLDDDRFFKITNKLVRKNKLQEGETIQDLASLEELIIRPAIRHRMKDLLLRCDYSSEELYRKIEQTGYHRSFAIPVMTEFLAAGYVDDRRYATAIIENKSRQYGPKRIRELLFRKGIDATLIDELMDERICNDQELLLKFLRKEDPHVLQTDPKTKQRIIRRFARKGFCYEDIKEALETYLTKGLF